MTGHDIDSILNPVSINEQIVDGYKIGIESGLAYVGNLVIYLTIALFIHILVERWIRKKKPEWNKVIVPKKGIMNETRILDALSKNSLMVAFAISLYLTLRVFTL